MIGGKDVSFLGDGRGGYGPRDIPVERPTTVSAGVAVDEEGLLHIRCCSLRVSGLNPFGLGVADPRAREPANSEPGRMAALYLRYMRAQDSRS